MNKEKIAKKEKKLPKTEVKKKEVFRVPPQNRQWIQIHLASSAISKGCRGYYDFVLAVNNLRGITKDKPLKEFYNIKYKEKIEEFNKAVNYINFIESYATGLDQKTISRGDIRSKRFRAFQKALAIMPLYEPIIFEFFDILVRETDIKELRIANRYWTLVRPKEKKLKGEEVEEIEGRKW